MVCKAQRDRVSKTPLLEALLQHAQEQTTPMHIPGHKQGSGVSEAFASALGHDPLRVDLTELPGAENAFGGLQTLSHACEMV